MMTELEWKQKLLRGVETNRHGKAFFKVRTAMEVFGFTANSRVREASLEVVLRRLKSWGFDCRFSSGSAQADDYITVSLRERTRGGREKVRRPRAPAGAEPLKRQLERDLVDPFCFTFEVDRGRLGDTCDYLLGVVWAGRPVCLLVDATDEMFALAGGYLAALMRRRALCARVGAGAGEGLPLAPTVLSATDLREITSGAGHALAEFPGRGAVYLVHAAGPLLQDDELPGTVRELFVPHTYRLRARFVATSPEGPTSEALEPTTPTESEDILRGLFAVDEPGFGEVVRWFSAFTGLDAAEASESEETGLTGVQLPSLLAEACQGRDLLLEQAALEPVHPRFKAGAEGVEHMALKNLLLHYLADRYPREELHAEETVWLDQEDRFAEQGGRRARPDVRAGNRVWVEVETLRGLSFGGGSPFLALEAKLRRKLEGMQRCEETWLIVPSDLALLARPQLLALVRNLTQCEGPPLQLRLGYMDVVGRSPVFLTGELSSAPAVELTGVSWRHRRAQDAARPLSRADIAGYRALDERLEEDLISPLMQPELYHRHGVGVPNGLLLYGLPGCGKSLRGRVLADRAGLVCRMVSPGDITSPWLGKGVERIRELFDWALRQTACVLILDELDGIAPLRSEGNMHTDEKREVNELLAQLDRIVGKRVTVVATTNYLKGIDPAVRRSGRFDLKVPVFPPTAEDRTELFRHYLGLCPQGTLPAFPGVDGLDLAVLVAATRLYSPADIRTVVEATKRRAVQRARGGEPRLTQEMLSETVLHHPRSLRASDARDWLAEVREEHPGAIEINSFAAEIDAVFGTATQDVSP